MRCTVKGCHSKYSSNLGLSFFRFPRDVALRDEWIKFCNRTNITVKNARICSIHFTKDDFEVSMQQQMGFLHDKWNRLKPTAVPTIMRDEEENFEVPSTLTNSYDICRLCMKEERQCEPLTNDGEESMINIFDTENLVQELKECIGLNIEADDPLPHQICRTCFDLLKTVVVFRETCHESDKSLRLMCHKTDKEIPIEQEDLKTIMENVNYDVVNVGNDIVLSSDTDLVMHDFPKENTKTSLANRERTRCKIYSGRKLKSKLKKSNTLRKRKTNDESKSYVCDRCGFQCTLRKKFATHMNRHDGIKPYQCEFCSEKFYVQTSLMRHFRKHTGELPFKCRFCERRFICNSSRGNHEKTHKNKRSCVCLYCGKAFNSSNVLKNHKLTHTGERNFKCKICNKSFQRQTHLSVHYTTRIHKRNAEESQVETVKNNIVNFESVN